MKLLKSTSRRIFLTQAIAAGLALPVLGLVARAEKEDVSPNEDLMREHGLLRRIALVYEENIRLAHHDAPNYGVIQKAAKIVRTFVEDYHEKLEEEFLFPAMRKAGHEVDLVNVLDEQHQAGRRLTDRILALSAKKPASGHDLSGAMEDFIHMYRAHAAREDTVLFPAFRETVGDKRYQELGELFEDREEKLFGKKGFEKVLAEVAELEKQMGIYDLKRYTPKE